MCKDLFYNKVYPIPATWLASSTTLSITLSNRELSDIQSYLKDGILRIEGFSFTRTSGLVTRIDLKIQNEFICPPLFFNTNEDYFYFPTGSIVQNFPDQIDLTGTSEIANSTFTIWISIRR